MNFAKIENGQLITAYAPDDYEELIAEIMADGFKEFQDDDTLPQTSGFQTVQRCFEDRGDHIYAWSEIVENSPEKIRDEIAALEGELSSTDYMITKANEYVLAGQPVPYDMAAVHLEREQIRVRIRELERMILECG